MKYNRCVTLLAAMLVASGCSSSAGDPAAAAPASPWLAIARGQVDVQGGLVLVAARVDGVVEAVDATPGQRVRKGQVLAKLDARGADIAVASAEAGVKAAQAQHEELQITRKQAATQAARIEAAARAGAATGQAAAAARVDVATLDAKLAAAAAGLDAARQTLAAARLELGATTLRAPTDGTVVARSVALGQSVSGSSAQPLFELLPDRPRIVRAQLDADSAAAIHAGMPAQVLRDSGNGPVQQARVLWVGEVLQGASLARDPLQRALANDVDCTLELSQPPAGQAPFRIGQRVLVRFPRQ